MFRPQNAKILYGLLDVSCGLQLLENGEGEASKQLVRKTKAGIAGNAGLGWQLEGSRKVSEDVKHFKDRPLKVMVRSVRISWFGKLGDDALT